MIWSSATGSETSALARIFSNSPMERRPSSVLFWKRLTVHKHMLRCLHFCLSNAVCQNESWKEKSVYPFILCFVYRCVSRNALPWLPLLRGVLVESWCPDLSLGRSVNSNGHDKRLCPQNVSCFSPGLTTPYTLALAPHFLALACNKSIL